MAEFKDGALSEFVEVFEGRGDPDYPNETNEFFWNYVYNSNKVRGCHDRFEYYIFELYKGGTTSNCFIIRNWDPYKEIFDPTLISTDYTDMNYISSLYQKYVSKNNLELPKMMIRSESIYFDKFDVGRIYILILGTLTIPVAFLLSKELKANSSAILFSFFICTNIKHSILL